MEFGIMDLGIGKKFHPVVLGIYVYAMRRFRIVQVGHNRLNVENSHVDSMGDNCWIPVGDSALRESMIAHAFIRTLKD